MTDAAVHSGSSNFRDQLRGSNPVAVVAFIVVVAGLVVGPPVAAVLVLLWLWISRTPARDVGLSLPKNWLALLALGIVIGIALKIAMKAVVMPLLGAPDVAQSPVHDYVRTPAGALDLATYAIYGAGFAEELVFRGFLFERLGRFFGRGVVATAIALVLITLFFGVAHWVQGVPGMQNAAITGFVLGLLFLATGRNLWLPMVAHAAYDLVAIAIVHYGYESQVAHLVFK